MEHDNQTQYDDILNDLIQSTFQEQHESNSISEFNPNLLKCHDQIWNILPDGIITDQRQIHYIYPLLKWPTLIENIEKNSIDYFNLFSPQKQIPLILLHTNVVMQEKMIRRNFIHGEFLKYLGIRLAMSLLSTNGGYRHHWAQNAIKESILLPGRFSERFQMSMSRFELITSSLRLCRIDNNNHDRWHPIREFIFAFNQTRKMHIVPGTYLTVDECMCSWKGLDGKFVVN